MSIKIISRGKGRSAISAAAYRSGGKITSEYDGIIHDYSHKGSIAHTEILLPDHAPREYFDRATLWNAVEKIEKNKNAQLAREIELALPVELSAEQNRALVREYVNRNFVAAGMCADVCIHDKKDGNPHAHVMLTMRPFEQHGQWGAKSKKEYILDENGGRIVLASGEFKSRKINSTDWNDQAKAEEWRAAWADSVNRFLEQNSVAERVDHRSYERQGIEQIPTIHMGAAASQMERRGILTERGNTNRRVHSINQELKQLRARISKLKTWLDEEAKATAPPPGIPSHPIPSISLLQILTDMLEPSEEKTRHRRVADLKMIAKAISFLQGNAIADLPGLQSKVTEMRESFDGISEKLKKSEQRMKTLDEHIRQADNYFQHRDIYRQYQQLKLKKQEAFFDRHRAELSLHEAAGQYLERVMNGRTDIPRKAWRTEKESLADERKVLYAEYSRLKDGVLEAESIRRCVQQATQKNKAVTPEKEMEPTV